MRVVVLLGGSSEERGVSLASGCQVAAALRSAGHRVTSVDSVAGVLSPEVERGILEAGIGRADVPEPPAGAPYSLPDAAVIASEPALTDAEVVFLALHGGAGEDGTIQTLLEVSGIPYAGSGPVACALAMNKDITKRLLRDSGVATPDWIVGEEAYVEGGEFTVGILDGAPLPVVEIRPVRELFDFDCKYETGMAEEIAPARIGAALADTLQSEALKVHRLLGLEHFSRVDFMVDGGGRVWCLEANALPGLTGNSLLPKAARAAGLKFPQLCERICRLGARAGTRSRW